MKCPDGPSPRNSLNHDSCSTSSFRIAKGRSYVRWSLPAVMLQMCEYPATAHLSAFTSTVNIALNDVFGQNEGLLVKRRMDCFRPIVTSDNHVLKENCREKNQLEYPPHNGYRADRISNLCQIPDSFNPVSMTCSSVTISSTRRS
jgi:hypothetical protein